DNARRIALIAVLCELYPYGLIPIGAESRTMGRTLMPTHQFSHDGSSLVFTAGDNGHIKVFTLPVPPTPSSQETSHKGHPTPLTERHAASSAQTLPNGRILFTASSLVSPNNAFIISGLENQSPELKQITKFGADVLEGKGLDPGEEFWFTGAKHVQVHGFALKPKGWKEGQKKKYPAVLLIHGGPQGAWEDSWSTRWNPNVPHTVKLSTSLEFTDAITEDWGGRPFDDMIRGWKYILEKHPEVSGSRSFKASGLSFIQIDPERTVAAGASWAGSKDTQNLVLDSRRWRVTMAYSIRIIMASLLMSSSSTAMEDQSSRQVSHWSTPQLVIHGGKDFRLAETEGIGAFHALQQYALFLDRFLRFLIIVGCSDEVFLADSSTSRMKTIGYSTLKTLTSGITKCSSGSQSLWVKEINKIKDWIERWLIANRGTPALQKVFRSLYLQYRVKNSSRVPLSRLLSIRMDLHNESYDELGELVGVSIGELGFKLEEIKCVTSESNLTCEEVAVSAALWMLGFSYAVMDSKG
ncbi:9145_t:CDS:2, partial [Acaulospora colombiana]